MKPTHEIVAKFPQHVQVRYDFSNAKYKGALTPITGIVCYKHGEFQQYSAQLRKDGAGCPQCGMDQRKAKTRMDPAEFVSRAEEVHPGKFKYERTTYKNMTTKVTVTCPDHGDFKISPIKLIHSAHGCPECGALRRGLRISNINPGAAAAVVSIAKHAAVYVEKARKVHGDLYDYSDLVYLGAKKKVAIKCQKHGTFWQTAEHHIKRRYGCPRCMTKSAPEDAVAAYLSIFTTVEQRNRSLIGPKELDIYLPEHNIAVEFCGMYWHSHTDRADEKKNKNRHAEKHRLCAEQGIRLITIYETEWNERPETIKRMLRNAIGKTKGKLMARKCELRSVGRPEAVAFYEKYHPQGGAGSGTHYGLYHKGKLVACMRFTYGGNDRGHGAQSRQWTLSRYASRISVAGAASRLFKAFLREHEPETVKSFSDNRLFGGGMYAQLGFDLEADVVPDYQVWSQKLGLRPKPHYQRRLLPARIKDHGVDEVFDPKTDTRTEAEMTYLMGARRIYDCGKKRWVWTAR